MKKMKLFRSQIVIASAAAVGCVAGCRVGPTYQRPPAVAQAPPATYKESPQNFPGSDAWKVAQPKDVDAILSQHQPSDKVKLVYKHKNRVRETNVMLDENPFVTIAPMETLGGAVTKAQTAFRNQWLGSKVTVRN